VYPKGCGMQNMPRSAREASGKCRTGNK
jgi:hypothetical protein